MEAMQPEFEDEEAINPFDFWQGANFKLKLKKVAGYWNYDSSEFASVSPLLDDDDALEAVWKKEYSLQALVAPDQFKSYDDLKKRLDMVLGNKAQTRQAAQETEFDGYAATEQKRVSEEDVLRKLEESAQAAKFVEEPSTPSGSTEDDDPMSYFAKLADS